MGKFLEMEKRLTDLETAFARLGHGGIEPQEPLFLEADVHEVERDLDLINEDEPRLLLGNEECGEALGNMDIELKEFSEEDLVIEEHFIGRFKLSSLELAMLREPHAWLTNGLLFILLDRYDLVA
jgi:hypothetical protein